MSDTTDRLNLPYILPAQAQKHVTHNDAVRMLDAAVQLTFLATDMDTPPAAPNPGDCYALGPAPTGVWDGKAGRVAVFQDDEWAFLTPKAGWRAYTLASQSLLVFDGTGWVEVVSSGNEFQNVALAGVNTTADATNRLAVSSPTSLFSHEGAGHQLKVNKAASTDTGAVLFQSNWQGRAELGLLGDDDWSLKVSDDGAQWSDAMRVDAKSGAVTFPNSGLATQSIFNLFRDGGRFTASAADGITVGAFQWPDYLTLVNSSTATGHGKFVHNNASYGGAGATLPPSVNDLVSKIRDPSARRLGTEFWVCEVIRGNGSLGPFGVGGETFHLMLQARHQPRLSAMTFHGYFRAIDDTIMVRRFNGQRLFVDGVEMQGNTSIEPAMNWVSVRVEDAQDPRNSYGYYPALLYVYSKSVGDRLQIACPCLTPGVVSVDPDIGPVSALNSW